MHNAQREQWGRAVPGSGPYDDLHSAISLLKNVSTNELLRQSKSVS